MRRKKGKMEVVMILVASITNRAPSAALAAKIMGKTRELFEPFDTSEGVSSEVILGEVRRQGKPRNSRCRAGVEIRLRERDLVTRLRKIKPRVRTSMKSISRY